MSPTDVELRQGFGILLGRPVESFDTRATYALYHWDDLYAEEFFDAGPDLAGVLAADESAGGLSVRRWSLDLSRSLFPVDDCGEVAVLREVAPELLGASFASGGSQVLLGRELGRILAGHGIDPAGIGEDGLLMPVHLRVVTDGTLFDAMRAATWTMPGEPLSAAVDGATVLPGWDTALDAVSPPELREHLKNLCFAEQSARHAGAWFDGAEWPFGTGGNCLGGVTAELVAAWSFGEGQANSWVVRLAPGAD